MVYSNDDLPNLILELSNSRLGVWGYFPETERELWSDGLVKILDFSQKSARRLFDFFPELQNRILKSIQSGNTTCHAELALPPSRDLFSFSLQIDYEPSSGAATRVAGIVQRVPASQQAPAATSTQTVYDILEAFTQSPGSVIFATDADGNYTFLSGSGLKHLGMVAEEWLGRSIFEFLKDAPAYQETIRKVLRGEYFHDKSRFGDHYFEDRFCPVYGPQGHFLGIVGIQIDVTDKVLAEKSLREKTDLLSGLFDGIPENAYILDLDYTIQEVNASAQKDFPDRELLGEKCYRALYARSTPCEFCPVVQTLQTGERTKCERLDERTGSYYELESIPIRNRSDDRIVGFTAFMRDITIQKRLEETARRNEDFLNTLMEVLTDGIYTIDTNYVITRCNKKVEATYPHLVPLEGRKCYETTTAKRICPDCAAEAMFREGKTSTRTFYERNNEDEPGGWFELTATPQYDMKTGKITGGICIVRDITPRIELESRLDEYRIKIQKMADRQMDELRMSEARLRTILETSGVAISFADYKGRFTYINGMYKELLGFNEEEIYGKHITSVIVPDALALEEGMDQLDFALNTNNNHYRTTQRLQTKDGRPIWCDLNVSVIRGNVPEETQVVSVFVDVTAQQEWNRRLTVAKSAAEEANEAKSQFLATMSHEIRTPLNGVIGISNLLLETELKPKQLEYAKLIKASGESLLFLINDILDFSKIEAGMLELDRISFDLYEIVQSVTGILASRAAEHSLELVTTFETDVPRHVFGDPGRLRQILINLVGNGLKFTHEGGVRIHVAPDERPNTLRFEVSDTGIGIPKSRLDRLFKRFSQVDQSSASVYGGTGLGLAISKKLVELMGGSIGVESEEGKGSTFRFTVVFEEDRQTVHDPKKTAPLDWGKLKDPQWKDETVLIACDNSIQRPALVDQMESWGFRTKTMSTAAETLERFQDGTTFRILIVDSTVDDQGGERLIRDFQDEETTAAIPIIFLVPLSEEPRHKSWRYPERIQFVSKPVQHSALYNAVVNAYHGLKSAEEKKKHEFVPAGKTAATSVSIRVLVAEDNRVNQIVISEILKNAGFDCMIAENGREAVDLIAENSFDVVLMDCQMPVMDGYQATEHIRDLEKNKEHLPHLPIIALTANATSEDEAKCLAAGMDAYCVKPIDPKKIVAMIRQRVADV